MDWTKTTTRRDEKYWSVENLCDLYYRFDGMCTTNAFPHPLPDLYNRMISNEIDASSHRHDLGNHGKLILISSPWSAAHQWVDVATVISGDFLWKARVFTMWRFKGPKYTTFVFHAWQGRTSLLLTTARQPLLDHWHWLVSSGVPWSGCSVVYLALSRHF